MSLSAAQTRVMQARTQIEVGRLDEVEPTLVAADGFLAGLPADEAQPIATQIAEIRAELTAVLMPADLQAGPSAGIPPVSVPAAAEPAHETQTLAAAPTADELRANHSRARGLVGQARSFIESGRTGGVGEVLDTALDWIARVAEERKAELLTEVDQLRAELTATVGAQRRRRVEAELNRRLDAAEDDLQWRPDDSAAGLRHVAGRLDDDDVLGALPPDVIAAYRTRIADIDELRLAATRSAVLDRARRAAAAGMVAVHDRLADADPGIEQYAEDWGRWALELDVRRGWEKLLHGIAGWVDETVGPGGRPLEEPDLPKTREAVQRLRQFLEDPAGRRVRAENAGTRSPRRGRRRRCSGSRDGSSHRSPHSWLRAAPL